MRRENCRSGSISKNHQLTNLNKCGKFHACIRNSAILALSRLATKHIEIFASIFKRHYDTFFQDDNQIGKQTNYN